MIMVEPLRTAYRNINSNILKILRYLPFQDGTPLQVFVAEVAEQVVGIAVTSEMNGKLGSGYDFP